MISIEEIMIVVKNAIEKAFDVVKISQIENNLIINLDDKEEVVIYFKKLLKRVNRVEELRSLLQWYEKIDNKNLIW